MGLPGDFLGSVDGIKTCEVCEQNTATVWVQGETDSFGHERLAMCPRCREDAKKPILAFCDWCKKEAELRPIRPIDEPSMCYDVCKECRGKHRRAEDEAFADLDGDNGNFCDLNSAITFIKKSVQPKWNIRVVWPPSYSYGEITFTVPGETQDEAWTELSATLKESHPDPVEVHFEGRVKDPEPIHII